MTRRPIDHCRIIAASGDGANRAAAPGSPPRSRSRSWRSQHRRRRGRRLGGRRRRWRRRAIGEAARGERADASRHRHEIPRRRIRASSTGSPRARSRLATEQDTFLVSATPFGPADSDRRLSVRQSQINWLSYTPTALGTITARAEANLFSLDLDGNDDAVAAATLRADRRCARRRQDLLDVRRPRRAADDARLQRAERRDVGAAVARPRRDSAGRRMDDRGRHRGFAGGRRCRRRAARRAHARAPAGSRRTPAIRLRAWSRAGRRAVAARRGERDGGTARTSSARSTAAASRSPARSRPSATIRSSANTRRARASGATSTMR